MNISFDTQSPTEGVLTVRIDPQDYQLIWEKNIARYGKKTKLKGFRKGHAPLSEVKKIYGEEALRESIFQVAEEGLFAYLRRNEIRTLGSPVLTRHTAYDVSSQNLTSCNFSYKIGLVPSFDLPSPDKLSVKAYKVTSVEKDALDQLVEDLRNYYATFQPAERAKVGSILQGHWQVNEVSIDTHYHINLNEQTEAIHGLFLGKEVGSKITLTAEKVRELGDINPVPEPLEKALLDTPDANFPFHVQNVYQRKLAPLNKDFYTKVLGTPAEKEEDFRQKLAQALLERDQRQAQELLANTLKETFIDATQIPLPDEILKVWLQTKKEKPLSEEEISVQYPLLARIIRWDLILDKLTKEHQLQPSSQEIHDKLIQLLSSHNKKQGPAAVDREAIEKKAENLLQDEKGDLSDRIRQRLREESALELIKEKSHIQYVPIASRAFYDILQAIKKKAEGE